MWILGCPHCKNMMPTFSEVSRSLAGETADIKLAAVDATQETMLQNKYSIKGYPTLKVFINGQEQPDYKGARSTKDIYNFMTSSKHKTEL